MLSHTSARVVAQYRGLWLVAPEYKLVPARGRLTETPVTGDRVLLDEGGAIAAIEPRGAPQVPRAPREGTGGRVLGGHRAPPHHTPAPAP